jgi:hypothetical protein
LDGQSDKVHSASKPTRRLIRFTVAMSLRGGCSFRRSNPLIELEIASLRSQ